MNNNLCIIPARGGSKRIPRKNIKNFFGKPIIAYSIEAALKSELFSEVMVSTDDQEIANIAIKYGAKVPFMRSKENADDFASTSDVLIEVVREYQNNGRAFNNICCLYPTAPFIKAERLKEAYQKLIKEEFEAVLPVISFGYPIQRALKLKDNRLEFFNPEFKSSRSQDLESAYHDAGQFYFLKTAGFIQNETIFSNRTGGIVITDLEAQDIDNESDWRIAEIKYEHLQEFK